MNRLDDIKARAAAATPGPWEVIDLLGSRPAAASVWTTEDGDCDVCLAEETSPADAAFIASARTDVPLLLAVAEAARLVKAQCDDMCPSWYDEPCDCGMAALRAALAPLLEEVP